MPDLRVGFDGQTLAGTAVVFENTAEDTLPAGGAPTYAPTSRCNGTKGGNVRRGIGGAGLFPAKWLTVSLTHKRVF